MAFFRLQVVRVQSLYLAADLRAAGVPVGTSLDRIGLQVLLAANEFDITLLTNVRWAHQVRGGSK